MPDTKDLETISMIRVFYLIKEKSFLAELQSEAHGMNRWTQHLPVMERGAVQVPHTPRPHDWVVDVGNTT